MLICYPYKITFIRTEGMIVVLRVFKSTYLNL